MKNANGVWKKLEPLFLKDVYDISDAKQEEADFAEKYIKILGITGTGLKGS